MKHTELKNDFLDRIKDEVIKLSEGNPWARGFFLSLKGLPSDVFVLLSFNSLFILSAHKVYFCGGVVMARFVPNPSFSLEDAIEGAKGKFTCPNCGEKFKEEVKRFEDNSEGVVCPKCGVAFKLKPI